ncbi:hypothetical protein O3M35_013038 [Rhynocoris fuscipes]|uniref:Chaoptin n=1 Tax=Rhynocoris fuscipes TaxID=488301 RepID=A0AAW1CFC8_9HEMI
MLARDSVVPRDVFPEGRTDFGHSLACTSLKKDECPKPKLEHLITAGYALVIFSTILMLWISYTSAGTCHFDAYCTCTSPHPNLGQIKCHDAIVFLPRLNHSKMFTLSLINNRMEYLPPNLLEGTGLYKLIISDNPLYFLHDETLSGLEWSLWELHITNCRLSNIPGNAIRHLKKLKTLNLTGNAITNISSEQLRGVANILQTLILANNHISVLPPGIFSTLTSLEILDLSGNSILSLEPSVFTPPPQKLHVLDLSDNLLDKISYKQLSSIGSSLHTVDLSYNRITTLYDSSSSTKLILDTISLDYNLIRQLETNSMNNFQRVNRTSFKGNPLEEIQPNAFRGCRIVELILSDCRLNSIDPESFNGLESSLQKLDLTGNNITTFDYTFVKNFTYLRNLHLKHNYLKDFIWSIQPKENDYYLELTQLHLHGISNQPIKLQSFPKLPHLQYLSISRIQSTSISPNDLDSFTVELEIFKLTESDLTVLNANMFTQARGIKTFDITDNRIEKIDSKCFEGLSHSLENLIMVHSFTGAISALPRGLLRPLSNLNILKINHNSLTKLPQEINSLFNLRILHAHDNKIDAIYSGTFLGEVHHQLIEINLSFNKIKKIPTNTFVDLNELIEINLSDNQITVLEEGAFANLHKLTKLNLRGNQMINMNAEVFQNLPSLECLDMAYNSLSYFTFSSLDQVGTLSTLTVNISNNNLAVLTHNATFNGKYIHSYIKILDMSFNNITRIDRNYFQPIRDSITHLYLSHNSLFNSSRDLLPEMPLLQLLDFSYNAFDDIEFDSLRSLKKIQVVILSHNKLKDIPEGLFTSLDTIRQIDLSYNSIYTIMDAIISPPYLVNMDLSHNKLTRMPLSAFTPTTASNLLHLNLSSNKISGVPSADSFSRFTKLLTLDLSDNRITDIGSSLYLLPNLISLNLANNNLHIGSKDFSGVEHSLRHLNIANVSISYVPPLPLPNLLTLDMSHNTITYIPPDLSKNLTNLKDFNMAYNSLLAVPDFPQLKSLCLAANEIKFLGNTSFAEFRHLTELDIRRLPLNEFDVESIRTLSELSRLHISNYPKIPNFNIPRWIEDNHALRFIRYENDGSSGIGSEFMGEFPPKVSKIIFSGLEIRSLPDFLLKGVNNPSLEFTLRNTSVEVIPESIFSSLPHVRNITLCLEGRNLKSIGNPSNTAAPNTPRRTFLIDFHLYSDELSCDCKIGWIETWQRKRRQMYYEDYYPIENARQIMCQSKKKPKSLLDTLKEEIECGWGQEFP